MVEILEKQKAAVSADADQLVSTLEREMKTSSENIRLREEKKLAEKMRINAEKKVEELEEVERYSILLTLTYIYRVRYFGQRCP